MTMNFYGTPSILMRPSSHRPFRNPGDLSPVTHEWVCENTGGFAALARLAVYDAASNIKGAIGLVTIPAADVNGPGQVNLVLSMPIPLSEFAIGVHNLTLAMEGDDLQLLNPDAFHPYELTIVGAAILNPVGDPTII